MKFTCCFFEGIGNYEIKSPNDKSFNIPLRFIFSEKCGKFFCGNFFCHRNFATKSVTKKNKKIFCHRFPKRIKC